MTDDLISRQALRSDMYHEAMEKDSEEQRWDGGCWIRYKMFERVIDRQPSAQSEIIRCKECKHQVKEWRTDKRLKDNGYMVCGCDVVGDVCGYWALLGQDDDYCSYAERRTDG